MASRSKLPERWRKEKQASRAVQVAFDIEERMQNVIRREAIDRGINPSDRVREILGLRTNAKPKRLRLSISLTEDDFATLAEAFEIDPDDRIAIKQLAAERLVEHVQTGQGKKQPSNKE